MLEKNGPPDKRCYLSPFSALGLWVVIVLLTGCRSQAQTTLKVEHLPLTADASCSGRFVAHDLPHVTAEAVERVGFFISNGSGLAVNDLDNDGDMDLVLGNIFGPIQIFWNEGDLQFQAETLFVGSVRAITAVDADGDGWLDLTAAKRNGEILHWRNASGESNDGEVRFEQERLGLEGYGYSLNWADLDGDGDLDLVSASYDASLEKQSGNQFRQSGFAGVYIHQNESGQFRSKKLIDRAQALSLVLPDVNQDGRPDIVVGNDFDVRDYTWLASDNGWTFAEPFDATTFSTMSMDVGDVNNDGRMEIFAADMHPYSGEREIMAQWQPVMEEMEHTLPSGDPQHMANALQAIDEDGQYENLIFATREASSIFVANSNRLLATGWSWSSKFGDLDQDGFLDLYVVNGMKALDNFGYLPNDELIEENQAFRNDGRGQFQPRKAWGLNSRLGGRGMSMADLDNDGDLDIIVNNLQAPAQIFENQLCEGSSLLVDLRWPGGKNTRAIGSRVKLVTSSGTYYREVRALSGYISGDPSQVHFGFPEASELRSLEITWPDGVISRVQDLQQHSVIHIERN